LSEAGQNELALLRFQQVEDGSGLCRHNLAEKLCSEIVIGQAVDHLSRRLRRHPFDDICSLSHVQEFEEHHARLLWRHAQKTTRLRRRD